MKSQNVAQLEILNDQHIFVCRKRSSLGRGIQVCCSQQKLPDETDQNYRQAVSEVLPCCWLEDPVCSGVQETRLGIKS